MEQIAGVVVVNVTGNLEVDWAVRGSCAPKVASESGEKVMIWEASAPGCGVVIPEIVATVESAVDARVVFPAKLTLIKQLPFQRALMLARVCEVVEPTY
jgi:hypothetical protein